MVLSSLLVSHWELEIADISSWSILLLRIQIRFDLDRCSVSGMQERGPMNHESIRRSFVAFVCLSALLLSACRSNPTPLPTALPQPTVTQRAVPTATPAPTQTLVPTETPAPATVLPTASIAPTSCTTPVSVTQDKGKVSYNGISFSYDPALATSFVAQDCPLIPYQDGTAVSGFFVAHTLFTVPSDSKQGTYFQPEIKVVAVNEENMHGDNGWFYPPLETLGDLQKMLAARPQPSPWFLAALHVRPRYLHFQNGTGVRAVVEHQMDPTFFTNDALLYAFDGLTRDGRYYVSVRFPIEAPFLIDIDGPDQHNVNPRAIPIPTYDANEQWNAVITYNQEALRRFDYIKDSDFTPSLEALDALVASLQIERVVPTATPAPTQTLVLTETPAPATVLPTASIAPTSCTTPVSVTRAKGKVSYNGISFSYDRVLATSFTAQNCPLVPIIEGVDLLYSHLAYTLFTVPSDRKQGTYFQPEIKVVAVNEENMRAPNGFIYPWIDTMSDLQKMLAARPQPSPWFDGAPLHVRPRYLDFQNGTGVRAVVEYAQDNFFIINNELLYAFDGLTRDGRYYVGVRFPIEAPFLIDIDGPDPRTNINPRAIGIPNWPNDYNEQRTVIEAYNQEALRRFDQMTDSDFTPSLKALDALVASLQIEPTR